MTSLIHPDELTPHDKLLLNAGQLIFAGQPSRAVALALAFCCDDVNRMGALGHGVLPDGAYLRGLAEGLIHDVRLPPEMLLHQLDVLRAAGYLTTHELAPGVPYTVSTCTLPLRAMDPRDWLEDDAYTHWVETDTYGLGELP